MADNKEKIQFFVGGVLVGLIIAGCFFIFKLDDYFEKLKLYQNITKTFYLTTKKDKIVGELEGMRIIEEEEEDSVTKLKEKEEEEKKEIQRSAGSKNELEPHEDTARSVTLLSDSLPDLRLEDEDMEDIVIQKDKMTASSVLQITDLSPLSASEKTSDSLLQKMSGIKDDRSVSKKNIAVELWTSPLHYKGYKMSKNKLILYGFPSLDGIKLFKLDDVIYIKAASNVYRLEQTYDYKAYQHVDNPSIVNKLK